MMVVLEVTKTADGSDTIFRRDLNQHYHSTFGAIQESQHIFIENGLRYILGKRDICTDNEAFSLNILEIGFGTGLNALLTLIESEKQGIRIHYTTVESLPLEEIFWRSLNYPHLAGDYSESFANIHRAPWDVPVELSPGFTLHKVFNKIEDFHSSSIKFDLVFFDAFGPDAQPELWTEEIFRNIGSQMADGGILVTYSVKGTVVRALRSSGFLTTKLPGPPGKRHILRAIKI
jgi:tRNA U34 5-methylaminomethyl-2-thiouridine-forming methyltransferase MnmC